jgi:hypothetical protein
MSTQPVVAPRKALADEPTVTMYFPKKVVLQRDLNPAPAAGEGGYVTFERGVNEVPESLSTHPWLRDNGARKYTRTAAEAKALGDQKTADEKQRADAAAYAVKRADDDVKAAMAQADAEVASLKATWDSRINELKAKADALRAEAPKPPAAPAAPAQPPSFN